MSWKENISKRIVTKIPALKDDEERLEELLADAFWQVMNHTNAKKYDTSWDNVVVICAVMLYNYSNLEGSVSRSNGGVSDTYESSNVLATTLSAKLPRYIVPAGTKLPSTRFNFPE